MIITRSSNRSFGHRITNLAIRLMQMQTAPKPAAFTYLSELFEAAAKPFRFDFHEVQLAESRRIGDETAIVQWKQFNMAGGMLPLPKR